MKRKRVKKKYSKLPFRIETPPPTKPHKDKKKYTRKKKHKDDIGLD